MKKTTLAEKASAFVIYAIVFAVAMVVGALFGGCASQKMYRAPCEHKVPMEEVNKTDGAVNYCPTCKKPFPYIPASVNEDEERGSFGWHWNGPYWRPYPYYYRSYGYGYGYRSYHHHADCR